MKIPLFSRILLLTLIAAVGLLGPGCAGAGRGLVFQQMAPLPAGRICSVAVLPFVNQSDYRQGGMIVYRVFQAELARAGAFAIRPEGDVRKVLRQSFHFHFVDIPDQSSAQVFYGWCLPLKD